VRPEGKGRDQQYETIYGNAASQHSSRLIRVVSRKQQKDRSASDRINDRKQRAHHQENTLGNLNDQVNLPPASRFEASRLELSPDHRPLAPRRTLRD
jgi:hypothetical protein